MPRYFLEVRYKGTRYSGFQVQENADTIQSEIEKAFQVLHRAPVSLTGSSRTDAGVHALQNYFHFDFEPEVHPQLLYKMNAILPDDISLRSIREMPEGAHSRFDAISRAYTYRIHQVKNPFLREGSLFYPYRLNRERMAEGAALIREQTNFFAFAKTNSQVRNFECRILECNWREEGEELLFEIRGNRFLRGMVRLLTATLLKLGRERIDLSDLEKLFREERKCGWSVAAHGLYLREVRYPENYFPASGAAFTGF